MGLYATILLCQLGRDRLNKFLIRGRNGGTCMSASSRVMPDFVVPFRKAAKLTWQS